MAFGNIIASNMDTHDNHKEVHQRIVISEHKTFKQNFQEWVKVIFIALLIALPVRYFIAEPFIVSGASMDPTFETGQFLIVDRISYRLQAPARGDVIVFEYPNNPSVYYIKRIIGLPGETVTIKNGQVTITKPSDSNFTSMHPRGLIVDQTFIDSNHASYDNPQPTTLSSTDYFVMGDNRAQSSDSRAWGPLNKKFIIGKSFVRLFPLSKISVWPGDINL